MAGQERSFCTPLSSGKGILLLAITQRAIKKIYIVYFLEFILKMIFIIIFVFFAVDP